MAEFQPIAEYYTQNPDDTRQLGATLGNHVRAGDVILLHGTLGAGKTHFTQGLARAIGVTGAVRSPTFTLVNVYEEGRVPLYHIDLYRVDGNADLATIGIEDYFEGEGVVVVEWSENGGAWIPQEALHIAITPLAENSRRLTFKAIGSRARQLLQNLLVSDAAGV